MRRALVCCLVLASVLSGCASFDWDPSSDATEADESFIEYLAANDTVDARWTGPAHDYRFEPVGEETVVLLAGSEGFVDTAAATGTADDVAIALPSE